MSCITTGWRKIGSWFGWFWFYWTEFYVISAIVIFLWMAVAAILKLAPVVAALWIVLWYISVAYLIVMLFTIILCLLIYIIDTLCNFFSSLWKKGWSAAWSGLWRDLARSFGWFKEEAFNEIYDRTQARIKAATDYLKKTKDDIIEKGSEAIDWLKGWVKKKIGR